MFDAKTLAQLGALKNQLHEAKEMHTGTVRGSNGRFGFVIDDTGASHFLPPEEMEKVFPDDRIEFSLTTGRDDKEQAEVETLLETNLSTFVGRYVVRGKAHCVEPSLPGLSRWLFIPPPLRNGAKEGDWLVAQVHQHPFEQGKAQAKVVDIIGDASTPHLVQKVTAAKYGLDWQLPEAAEAEASAISEADIESLAAGRDDLTDLPLVTIDSASTKDMDDAVFVETTNSGWKLTVAIADPAAFVTPGTAMDAFAKARAATVYMPGKTFTMLPRPLTEVACSLVPNKKRLALVITQNFSASGEPSGEPVLQRAVVESKAKLSYEAVSQSLESGETIESPAITESLTAAKALAEQLLAQRHANNIVMTDRPDYEFNVDELGALNNVLVKPRTLAHKIIEEFMLATNQSVARWLAAQQQGFFVTNAGVRDERKDVVKSALAETWQLDASNIESLAGYLTLVRQLNDHEQGEHIRRLLARNFSRTEIKHELSPHMPLGMSHYTTVTSPIRKYTDLMLHRIIVALLEQQPVPNLTPEDLAIISDRQGASRRPANEAESWMMCEYLQRDIDKTFRGQVVGISKGGVNVVLTDVGAMGFAPMKRDESFEFLGDSQLAKLADKTLTLGIEVDVLLAGVDVERRALTFKLV
ncbi:VacB/RNase II family 3'-5' exoribonuclease [Salinibius halmophilus]|uniref:VacB/RNase II family 3'-5' exoribonuclease n=1 Tax=Salinibius halmophilus TaxID=1853216 RepID=UPI000E667AD1|nr:VacB/RNase II family 3'-5' exoribonuclease [Salinibius halmophilus]